MKWIKESDCNWDEIFEEGKTIVAVLKRNDIDVICGYISFISTDETQIELTSSHQGKIEFNRSEIEKVMILDDFERDVNA